MLLVWERYSRRSDTSRSRRSNKELTPWSDLVLPKKWLGNSEILFKPMKETHLFVTGPYWESWNFSEFWRLNCPFFQKWDLTLAGPNHHSSQKPVAGETLTLKIRWTYHYFIEVEFSSHKKGWSSTGVEMLSTASFKSRYSNNNNNNNIMTAQNNLKSRAISSVIIISISAD